MTATFEYGAVPGQDGAGERPEDVTFDGAVLSPSGLPEPAQPTRQGPPAVPVPAAGRPVPAAVHASSDLDALFGELQRDLGLDDLELVVPARPGWTVRYRLLLDKTELQPWRKAAYNRDIIEGIDEVQLASLGLAALCTGIARDGRLALDEHGQPVTFRTPEFAARLRHEGETKAPEPAEAVLRWYAFSANAVAAWQALLEKSGFTTVLVPVHTISADPTAAPPDPS